MATEPVVKPPKPAIREKGYVHGQISAAEAGFSQWEMFERVPDLQWPASVQTFSRMLREDSRVSSLLAAITLPILRAQWRIAPNGARDEVVEFVARNMRLPIDGAEDELNYGRSKGRFSWKHHLPQALTALPYGHSVFEQVYREENGKFWLRKLAPRPQRTISNWNVALDGGLMSIEQAAPASTAKVIYGPKPLSIPISRLVVYTRDMEPGMWVGNSLLRPSFKHWLIKDELIRYQAMAIRRTGMGIPVATAADGASDEDVNKLADMAMAYRGGDNAGVGLPFGADLKLVAPNGNLIDIGAAIAYHDNMIAIAGLAHFLNLEGKGGSYALASVQEHTFSQSVQTVGEQTRDIGNAHVIEDLVDINFGLDEQAPLLVFDEIGSHQTATAAALKMLVEAGLLSPDILVEQKVRQHFGIPAKADDTPPAQPTPGLAPVAPAASARATVAQRATVGADQGTLF
ncbi:portal protein [Gordonia phage Utz]|uniref:portal protein n=1 Tax=Gordonia phage Utz TaxID=1838081 RepID=UPI0007B65069|nr:portal protein [Gordonia phage Utz]ANA86870.1 portal protein [Gordonia phage Utz]QKO02324.1 portal protein [Gordonia phage BlingBling]QNJ57900.1 portal protein [Gordonia phage Hitter]QWY84271.1 portal protein [Gordonia phage Jalammah]